MDNNTDQVMAEGGLGSDVAGIPSFFIDPPAAAKRVRSATFWIVPLIISAIITVAVSYYMTPFAIHAAAVSPVPDGMTSDQMVKGVTMSMKIALFAGPVFVVIFTLMQAAILLLMALLLGAKATFGQLVNLVAGCGLIMAVASIATAVILHFKGEVSSMAELRPALGPDIFMPEGTNKMLIAAASCFSVFHIWWVVMLALIFAVAFGVSKAKGFVAVLPLWVLTALFTVLGAAFQK